MERSLTTGGAGFVAPTRADRLLRDSAVGAVAGSLVEQGATSHPAWLSRRPDDLFPAAPRLTTPDPARAAVLARDGLAAAAEGGA